MSDRSEFMRQIVENPADDTVRLVYADWLEEHGEPERAAFIRTQIELARVNRDAYSASQNPKAFRRDDKDQRVATDETPEGRLFLQLTEGSQALTAEALALLERHATEWMRDTPSIVRPHSWSAHDRVVVRTDDWRFWIEYHHGKAATIPICAFRRGFVGVLNYQLLSRSGWDETTAELFRLWPIESVKSHRQPISIGPYWIWIGDDDPERTDGDDLHVIPEKFSSRLPHREHLRGGYPDQPSAWRDFQWALVAYGRELAGLPMLPKPPLPERPDPKRFAQLKQVME